MTQVNSIDLKMLSFEKRRKNEQVLAQIRLHSSQIQFEKELEFGDQFLIDCQRIVTTRKFRKMAHTMQVMFGGGVLFRSRLTHAIDSSVIAERIAVNHFKLKGKSLSLIKASVLAHDIGQSPLGYSGNKALERKLHEYKIDFDDSVGAIKVLCHWSNYGISFAGLNPTVGLLRQIALGGITYRAGVGKNYINPKNITQTVKEIDKQCNLDLNNWADIEGLIANIADGLSWINEDIMAGLIEGIFTLSELTSASPLALRIYHSLIFDMKKNGYSKKAKEIENKFYEPLGLSESDFVKLLCHYMLNEMILDLVTETKFQLNENKSKIKFADDSRKLEQPIISLSPAMYEQWNYIFKFFYKNLYSRLLQANGGFEDIIERIFDHLYKNPQYMDPIYQKRAVQLKGRALAELVLEYIMMEMTDREILNEIELIDPGLFEIIINNMNAVDHHAL